MAGHRGGVGRARALRAKAEDNPLAMIDPMLYNDSPFHATVLPILDRDGVPSRVVIVKATYDIRPEAPLALAKTQREVRLGDELWGPPEVADIRLPGDFYPAKPGTDVVLSGHAVPPHGPVVHHVDVDFHVHGRLKRMRVHGPRTWKRSFTQVVPGPSAPLQEPVPLAWSRAYGGLDLSDPSRRIEHASNPVGSGIAREVDDLVGQPAPQIESHDEPIGAAGSRGSPVGCAPLGRHFEPRRQSAGTCDSAWLQDVYPARPADYDEQHEHFAPPDLVFHEPLRGGESVWVRGVHRSASLAFTLPKVRIVVDAEIDGDDVTRRPHLDTVVVDADAMVVELVWRALFRCPARMTRDRFPSVRVQAKDFLA